MTKCPHIRGTTTQWCELAERSVKELRAEATRLRAELREVRDALLLTQHKLWLERKKKNE